MLIQRFCLLSLVLLCSSASWIDWRSRRIPNYLIIWGLKAVIIAIMGDAILGLFWHSFLSRLAAGSVAAAIHCVPYGCGKMGAGDLKLAFVIGLLMGWPAWCLYLGCYGIILGVGAVIIFLRSKREPIVSLPLAPLMGIGYLLYLLQHVKL